MNRRKQFCNHPSFLQFWLIGISVPFVVLLVRDEITCFPYFFFEYLFSGAPCNKAQVLIPVWKTYIAINEVYKFRGNGRRANRQLASSRKRQLANSRQ